MKRLVILFALFLPAFQHSLMVKNLLDKKRIQKLDVMKLSFLII